MTENRTAEKRRLLSLYGDGSDGDVTINAGTTTLTRDMWYEDLTLSGTGVLVTDGFRVFVSGTLDLSAAPAGAIKCNGNNGGNGSTTGAGAAPTAPTSIVTLWWSERGPEGKVSGLSSTAPQDTPFVWGGRGGGSGKGGDDGDGGGVGGSALASNVPTATALFDGSVEPLQGDRTGVSAAGVPDETTPIKVAACGVGGASGGSNTAAWAGGGGGGSSGGMILIFARLVAKGTNATASIIQAKGGTGGNGGTALTVNRGGGGGAGGGGGGAVQIMCDRMTGSTITNAVDVSGGTGGNGGSPHGTGTAGDGAYGGCAGQVLIVEFLTRRSTRLAPTTTPAANAGQTGGTGVAGLVSL